MLHEFLLTRIAEDETVAQRIIDYEKIGGVTDGPVEFALSWWCDDQGNHVAFRPQRVLAECEAKRRIVELSYFIIDMERVPTGRPGVFDKRPVYASRGDEYDEVLRLLALPYADHPDYDETWRP